MKGFRDRRRNGGSVKYTPVQFEEFLSVFLRQACLQWVMPGKNKSGDLG